MISARQNVPVNEITLLYKTMILENRRSFADYNIQEDCVKVMKTGIGDGNGWVYMVYTLGKSNKSQVNIDQTQIDLDKKKSDENEVEMEKSEGSSNIKQEPSDSMSHESVEGLVSLDYETLEDSSSTSQEPIDSMSHESVENVFGTSIEVNNESLQFEISIRCLGGDSENFEVSANDTVDSLKKLIARRITCEVHKVKLIFAGEPLEGEGTLAEHNIQIGSKIYRIYLLSYLVFKDLSSLFWPSTCRGRAGPKSQLRH
jgi:hypothetical protein